jgi:hypothetical protein
MTLLRSHAVRSTAGRCRGAARWWRAGVSLAVIGAAWQDPVPPAVDSAARAAVAPALPAPPAIDAQGRAVVPWGIGERLNYEVKFGILRVGNGSMTVEGPEAIRGREAYHTVLTVRGGTPFFRVDDRFESWFDTRALASLRFVQDQQEGRKERERRYEIFPERAVYREGDKAEQPSVADPLDDGSFIYYVRTLPLRPGDVYEVPRYFKPDRNPVRIRVLRRERVRVPAGTFDAIVVQPIIQTKGIFSENGRAEVWLADDSTRVMLQMKSHLSFGSLNLYLTSYRAPTSDRAEGR